MIRLNAQSRRSDEVSPSVLRFSPQKFPRGSLTDKEWDIPMGIEFVKYHDYSLSRSLHLLLHHSLVIEFDDSAKEYAYPLWAEMTKKSPP